MAHTTAAHEHEEIISLISIGIHRLPTMNTALAEQKAPYRVVAFLDFDPATTPPAFQYSAHNLGVLLYNLHPRPRALLTVTAVLHVSEGIVEEVKGVSERYVRDVLEEEEGLGRSCYVALTGFHSEMGPPPPGTMEYAIRKLDEVFRPHVKHE